MPSLMWVALAGALGCRGSIAPASTSTVGVRNLPVDIVFVVDDTDSMANRQRRLALGVPSLVAALQDATINARIGVTTTSADLDDPDAGRLLGDPPMLGLADADALADRMEVGIDGSPFEGGLEAALLAVDGKNPGVPRYNSRLALVFVTDENDCSHQGAITGGGPGLCHTEEDALVPVADYLEAYEAIAPTVVHGIVGIPGSTCADAFMGQRIGEAIEATDGILADICAADYIDAMDAIGWGIAQP